VSRLIHLNGAPGVGKSTLARRYAADHPGVLVLEIDQLRTMVAGWQDDPAGAGTRIRAAALAAITAYLLGGGDVVLPQLIGSAEQLSRFEAAARDAEADYAHVVLTAPPDEVVRRFRARGDDHPWARQVTAVVDADGGDEAIREWTRRVGAFDGTRIEAGDVESTYRALVVALAEQV
jgi:predicted kinase